jgi:hypothetical protein
MSDSQQTPDQINHGDESGRHVTFAEGLQLGGRPLGWILGTLGVMIWIIWEAPTSGTSPWPNVRWAVTAVIVLAWIVPTYLVPVPSAARAWKWAAALTAAVALLISIR